jgi:hypothetical protein
MYFKNFSRVLVGTKDYTRPTDGFRTDTESPELSALLGAVNDDPELQRLGLTVFGFEVEGTLPETLRYCVSSAYSDSTQSLFEDVIKKHL